MEYANRSDIPVRGSVYPAPPTRANPDCERVFRPFRGRIVHGAFLHGRGIIADYCDALTLVIVRLRGELCDGDVLRLAVGGARADQEKHQCNGDARRSHASNETQDQRPLASASVAAGD
jgi:hypothetical protein